LPTASLIIAAAGAGRRFAAAGGSGDLTKVFMPLAGRPVLSRTLEQFARVAEVAEAIVAVPPSEVDHARRTFGETLGPGRRLVFVAGGAERPESVALALAATDRATDLVAIQDAVRPLIRPEVIRESFRVAAECGAAVVGRPVDHTIKRVGEDRRVHHTVPRHDLWIAQTPQVFRRTLLEEAYRRRGEVKVSITDDAQLAEALGHKVVMVLGDAVNLKITTPEDLRICEALLAAGWPSGEASDEVTE
jgi:2-C-methyl-D-erythritol 4-phosphate cytidylyltransferase